MSPLQKFGMQAASRYVQSGDATALRKIIADCNAKSEATRSAGISAMAGMLTTFGQVLEFSARHGVRFTGSRLPTVDECCYAVRSGPAEISRILQLQMNALAGLRKVAPAYLAAMRIDAPASEAGSGDATPVRVVSMPTRQITTDIERNAAGDITGSMQIEKDF